MLLTFLKEQGGSHLTAFLYVKVDALHRRQTKCLTSITLILNARSSNGGASRMVTYLPFKLKNPKNKFSNIFVSCNYRKKQLLS